MFASIDIYGKQISFDVAGRNSFQTNLGSCFTLGTLVLTIFCCLVFGSDLYFKENPSVVDQTSQPLETTPLYFNRDNYTMVFSFGDDYFNFDPTGLFTISITNEYIDNFHSNKNSTAISLRNCTKHDMRNYLGLFQQGHFLCFDIAEFNLNGSWTEHYLSRIKFVVNRCKNSSHSPIICKPDDVITKKVQDDVYFNIYTEDNSVNTNNYKSPFTNYIKDLYWLLDNNLGKHAEVFLKKVTIDTDSGTILTSKVSEFVHKFEHYDLDVVSNLDVVNRSYPFMKLILYASSHTQQIKRIYPKIQFVAAEVSGIIKIFSMACMIFLSVYSKYALTIFLINSEFDNTRKLHQRKNFPSFGDFTHIVTTEALKPKGNIELFTEFDKPKFPESEKIHLECDYTESIEEKAKPFGFLSVRPKNQLNSNPIEGNIFERPINEEKIQVGNEKLVEENTKSPSKLLEKSFEISNFPKKSNCVDDSFGRHNENKILAMESTKAKTSMSKSRRKLINSARGHMENSSIIGPGKLGSKNTLIRKATLRSKLQSQNHKQNIFTWRKNIDDKDLGFKFTFWDYILSMYLPGYCLRRKKQANKKLKIFQKASGVISSYFDARVLIRKIIDIERIKKLLLNDEQLKVYEFLTKPKLFYEKEEKGTSFTINDMVPGFVNLTEKKLEEKITGVDNFYKRVLNEENPNQIDHALFNMLDEDLRVNNDEEEGTVSMTTKQKIDESFLRK